MKFGEKIVLLRKQNGLTQGELSERTGLSLRTIVNYERYGKLPKKRESIDRLAEALGVNASYLSESKIVPFSTDYADSEMDTKICMLLFELTSILANPDVSNERKEDIMLSVNESYWRFLLKQKTK